MRNTKFAVLQALSDIKACRRPDDIVEVKASILMDAYDMLIESFSEIKMLEENQEEDDG